MVAARRITFGVINCEKQAFTINQRLAKGAGFPAKAVMPEKIFAGRTICPAFPAKAGNHIFSPVRAPLEVNALPPLEIAYPRFQ